MPCRPSAPIAGHSSRGNQSSASIRAASGAIWSVGEARASCRGSCPHSRRARNRTRHASPLQDVSRRRPTTREGSKGKGRGRALDPPACWWTRLLLIGVLVLHLAAGAGVAAEVAGRRSSSPAPRRLRRARRRRCAPRPPAGCRGGRRRPACGRCRGRSASSIGHVGHVGLIAGLRGAGVGRRACRARAGRYRGRAA